MNDIIDKDDVHITNKNRGNPAGPGEPPWYRRSGAMSRPSKSDIQLHIRLQILQLPAENPRMSQPDLSHKMGVAL